MSDTVGFGLFEAAQRLGVSVRTLRDLIRAGMLPAPPHLTATAPLPPEWLENARTTLEGTPGMRHRSLPPKVPAFARYVGTSAWRKYPNRVREYVRFRAAMTRMSRSQVLPGA